MKKKGVDALYVKKQVDLIKKESKKLLVGQDKIVHSFLRAIFANGHVLLEGIPGIGKTLAIRVLASTIGCSFSRIQFTVDLLPTDITGITSYTKERGFFTLKGPVFANLVLADEINRAPPKTQSALLEAMQEKQTTIGKETFKLPLPFFVMATQNPIEQAGTYRLPEAQIDRFLFKVDMVYPSNQEELEILEKNISVRQYEDFKIKSVINPKELLKFQEMTRNVYVNQEIMDYIVRIVNKTRDRKGIQLGKYIQWGASPRASIGLYIAAKAEALLNGSDFVKPQHVKNVAYEVMRHRILLTYEAEAEQIKTDQIIDEILSKVPIP